MDLSFFIYSFVALFVIVDPVMNIPVFMAILERFKAKHRPQMIKTAVVSAFFILLAFSFLGGSLLNYLGVSLASFKIAGGVLLFLISLEMVFGQMSKTKLHPSTLKDAKERDSVAISPLSIPLLTGPGALTTGMVLVQSATSFQATLLYVLAAVLVFVATYLILVNAELVSRKIGTMGTRAIARVMGVVLSAIAVNLVVQGIQTVF